MNHHDLATIRAEQVARCLEQARLGHNDASLRIMGFADGCIREARAQMACPAQPMTRPGDVTHD